MQIITYILLTLGGVIALALATAAFMKKEYFIERAILIQQPVSEVFAYVRVLKNQESYSKWVMTDPQMRKMFRGDDGEVGAVYAWNGNKQAGEGEEEIISLEINKRIDIEVRFVRPFESTAHIHMITESVSSDETKVRWGMAGRSKYPMNLMTALVSKMLAKDLETSLNTLKSILEKKPVAQEA